MKTTMLAFLAALALAGCATTPTSPKQSYDLILRGGTIYDGSGGAPYVGDVAVTGDRIAYVGRAFDGGATREVDARGLAVAPGFINMLSHSQGSLPRDGRGLSEIMQGVTLQVMGEGWTRGPLNPEMKRMEAAGLREGDDYQITWTTLGEFLEFLERRGTSHNVASFVGATTVRIHELGEDDVDPAPAQLDRMRALVRQAMNEGAMGVGSALIYAPGSYAETDELVALMTEAGKCGGMYVSHMRSEGDRLLESVDELIEIARRSNAPAEIYHLKMAGRQNWDKLPEVVRRIKAARAEGVRISTDMYVYTAGGTGLDAAMLTWVQAGGDAAWIERLKDPAIRARVAREMRQPGDDWENLFLGAGPEGMVFASFRNPALNPLIGKSLAEVARMRGKPPEEVAMDLVVEDGSRVGTLYFLMSEDNVRRQIQLPWMSFGSDAASVTREDAAGMGSAHPRAYGNFARVLGRYVREEKLITLQEAIRRFTSLPAANLGVAERGALKAGQFADIAVFDPATIADRATFEDPHQYAVGMRHVFVNGVQVLNDGTHTGATPGRVVRGKGWKICS